MVFGIKTTIIQPAVDTSDCLRWQTFFHVFALPGKNATDVEMTLSLIGRVMFLLIFFFFCRKAMICNYISKIPPREQNIIKKQFGTLKVSK